MKRTNKKKLKKKLIKEIKEVPFNLDYEPLYKSLVKDTYNNKKLIKEILEECKECIDH